VTSTTNATARSGRPLPPRFVRPSISTFLGYLVGLAVLVWSIQGSGWSTRAMLDGVPALMDFLSRAWPPSLTRIETLSQALVQTFQMAIVGTVAGVVLSVPLAILAARGLLAGRIVNGLARAAIAFFRTVPDLVWALIFVIAVGLGPFAGTLAIAVDTAGFCGRFFAEAMEDTDKGPVESLRAQGVRRLDTIFCAVIPAAMPAFITTTLFALEKSTRSSVILGLVGAGGIGLELKVAMDMFDYPTAATVILMVFGLVMLVEQAGSWARGRIIG
jgi:phosphonate transport system permease protein